MNKFVLSAVVAAAALTAVAPPAQAAVNPYTPHQVCGSGYYVLERGQIPLRTSSGAIYGYAYMMYNSSTRKNCVATIKAVEIGVASFTYAAIQVPGQNVHGDHGYYKYYAGPVYMYAPGTCVKAYGVVWNRTGTVVGQGESPFDWCD